MEDLTAEAISSVFASLRGELPDGALDALMKSQRDGRWDAELILRVFGEHSDEDQTTAT